uniref:Uncharacterized protein n=1 Tax=Anopheles farauti TaxID=69004 RepID=A0A182QNB7_9DIPT
MADESLHVPDTSIDFHIVQLFERLEAMRKEPGQKLSRSLQGRINMHTELRSLELWRSITCESLASFFYVFIVCGAAAGAGVGASVSSVLLATALSSGFSMIALTQCFLHISGAHVNPAVTIGMLVSRQISPLRALLYIVAQSGGSIAGAALLYGVTVPGYQGNLQAAVSHSSSLAAWERFGVEFILTFIVVLAYLISTNSFKKYFGSSAIAIGAAYSACSFVSMPYLNPARSLGPSFVLNKWDNHWVYWVGPMVGGAVSGVLHEFIFSAKRSSKRSKDDVDSSLNSEDDINYDMDLEKPSQQQQQQQHQGKYHQYRPPSGTLTGSQQRYCQSIYTAEPTSKVERVEPIYGGTKSMYCKSPPLTRANLNRSQSVYAKSNTALNRDLPVRAGPLVPAQSLYPLRVSAAPQTHLQNQNVQNQLQQRSDSIYGIRSSMRQPAPTDGRMGSQMPPPMAPVGDGQGFQPIYGSRNNPNCSTDALKFDRDPNSRDDTLNSKFSRGTGSNARPESMYGGAGQRRIHSAQSDDSSYGSYHGPGPALTPPTRNASNSSSTYNPVVGTVLPNYERKTSSSSSSNQQQQQQQQQQSQQSRGGQNGSNIQNTSLPPPPPPLHHTMQYAMHPVRQN